MTLPCRSLLALAAFSLVVCLPSLSYAWGAVGHRFITAAAIKELPAPLRTIFQSYANRVTNNAAIEPPGTHFIDIDYYPEFFAGTFPRDLNVLIAQYGSSVVTANGTGPWTAVTHYETLRSQFATAQTTADWTNLLNTAATLAHFLEDLHNPMHLATNYNGQYSGQTGLHSRYESTMIQNQLAAGFTLASNATDCVYYLSLRDAIFDDINIVHPYNAAILAADWAAFAAAGERTSANYHQHLWDDGCSSFTPMVLQRAAGMVASAWYSAWRDAGFPQPPGVVPSTQFRLQPVGGGTGMFRFTIHGDAGQRLQIETSTNLVTWVSQGAVTNLNGRTDFVPPAPVDSGPRFYRAVLPQ
jgi:hypothetical protein